LAVPEFVVVMTWVVVVVQDLQDWSDGEMDALHLGHFLPMTPCEEDLIGSELLTGVVAWSWDLSG